LRSLPQRFLDDVFHLDDDDERRRLERVALLIDAAISTVQGATLVLGPPTSRERGQRSPAAVDRGRTTREGVVLGGRKTRG
jgi:hypothetical protein